jgi:hypothetical protein
VTTTMSARRLAPETVSAMRRFVEETPLSYDEIGRRCHVSAATVWRYATEAGWTRHSQARPSRRAAWPRAAAPPPSATAAPALLPAGAPSPEARRGAVIEDLWRLTEAQARQWRGAGSAEPRLLKTLVEVLERLTRLEEEAARREKARGAEKPAEGGAGDGATTFEEINAMLDEIARRFLPSDEQAHAEEVEKARHADASGGPAERQDAIRTCNTGAEVETGVGGTPASRG